MVEKPPMTPSVSKRASVSHTTMKTPLRYSYSEAKNTSRRKFNTWNPKTCRKLSSGNDTPSSTSSRFGRPSTIVRNRSSLSSSVGTSSSSSSKGPSVCVMVRVRPLQATNDEVEKGGELKKDADSCIEVIDLEDDSDMEDLSKLRRGAIRIGGQNGPTFTFDRVFSEADDQSAVFADAGRPIAENALQGYNASIFAYGQTGSGKTFTMQGKRKDEEGRGLMPRVLEHCFAGLEQLKQKGAVVVAHCSFLEIYNEQIFDLLEVVPKEVAAAPGYSPSPKSLREDVKRGVFVDGAHWPCITSVNEAFEYIWQGSEQRHIGSTKMNRESSRSHSIFTLALELKIPSDTATGTLETTKTARVNLIDLAGSERQCSTQAVGERLNESKHINKSLSALGNVISALVEKSKGRSTHMHIPYRDSALTYLLRDSLGGNTKTSIIATISPDSINYQDTLSTLQFGQRAKRIRLSVKENITLCSDVNLLRSEIDRLREELKNQKKVAAALIVDRTEPSHVDELPKPPAIVNGVSSDAMVPHLPSDILYTDPDFIRLEKKVLRESSSSSSVGNRSSTSSAAQKEFSFEPDGQLRSSKSAQKSATAGELVLRKRLSHLELVMVQLCSELQKSRVGISNFREEAKAREQLEETLRSQLLSKEMIINIQNQKMESLSKGDEYQKLVEFEEALSKARDSSRELELEAKIASFQAENDKLSHMFLSREDDEVLQKRLEALEVQVLALGEDKVELEGMLRDAQEKYETAIKFQEVSAAVSSPQQSVDDILGNAMQEELDEALLRIEALEQELFQASEDSATQDVISERVLVSMERQRVLETGSRRHSAGEALQLRHKVSQESSSTPSKPHGAGRMSITGLDFSSPSVNDRAALLVASHGRKKLPFRYYESSLETPGKETDQLDAEKLVLNRLTKQVQEERNKYNQAKKEIEQLKLKLETTSSSAKKTQRKYRKSLSAKESRYDKDHDKIISQELTIARLSETIDGLTCQNTDLKEALQLASSHGEYQARKNSPQKNMAEHRRLVDELKKTKEQLAKTEQELTHANRQLSSRDKENSRLSLNSVTSDTSVATTATIQVKRCASDYTKVVLPPPVSQDESYTATPIRRATRFSTATPLEKHHDKDSSYRDSMLQDFTNIKQQSHRKTLPSVASFFPESSPATSIAKENVAKLDAEQARLSGDGVPQNDDIPPPLLDEETFHRHQRSQSALVPGPNGRLSKKGSFSSFLGLPRRLKAQKKMTKNEKSSR